jgi:hypothetical protein
MPLLTTASPQCPQTAGRNKKGTGPDKHLGANNNTTKDWDEVAKNNTTKSQAPKKKP